MQCKGPSLTKAEPFLSKIGSVMRPYGCILKASLAESLVAHLHSILSRLERLSVLDCGNSPGRWR